MGFCSSSTCENNVRGSCTSYGEGLRAYQESTGNKDNDAAFAGGLSVEGGDLVTDLLEGKALSG
jgi:hypothetical protein